MSCENKVSYYVPKGYDYREVLVTCGSTDPHGSRAVCDECSSNFAKMREIEAHEANVKADNETARMSGYGEY